MRGSTPRTGASRVARVSCAARRTIHLDGRHEIRFDPENKPGISNLLTIFSALTGRGIPELEVQYAGQGYGALKGDLADAVVEFVTPFRERTMELLDDKAQLAGILRDGAERAHAVADQTLRDVMDRVGFLPSTVH